MSLTGHCVLKVLQNIQEKMEYIAGLEVSHKSVCQCRHFSMLRSLVVHCCFISFVLFFKYVKQWSGRVQKKKKRRKLCQVRCMSKWGWHGIGIFLASCIYTFINYIFKSPCNQIEIYPNARSLLTFKWVVLTETFLSFNLTEFKKKNLVKGVNRD